MFIEMIIELASSKKHKRLLSPSFLRAPSANKISEQNRSCTSVAHLPEFGNKIFDAREETRFADRPYTGEESRGSRYYAK